MHRLESIGWSPEWELTVTQENSDPSWQPARVAAEHKGALKCLWEGGELTAEISGRLRYLISDPLELPAVGDWVLLSIRPEEARGTIHATLPRRTALVRKAPERPSRAQMLAANVDTVLIVTSANAEFRPRRLERMLALVGESGAEAILVVSKLDLSGDPEPILARARDVAAGRPVLALSAQTGEGIPSLDPHLGGGRTLALLGSSGVGKSTLANRLLGTTWHATREVRADDDRGRHTTSHRELVALPGGGVLIDTPGLREVGLWEDEGGIESAFPDVEARMQECRFHDCGHGNEPGCAVRIAIEEGELDPGRYASFLKLQREARRQAARHDTRAQHEQRKERKRFSKAIRKRVDKRDR